MSHDTKFDKSIADFQRYGTFTYKYDEIGNVIFNSSSNEFAEVYLAFPLPNYEYDDAKILGFYDATFTEFIPTTTETTVSPEMELLQSEIESIQSANAELVKQLDTLIAQNESTPTAAERQATKQVILELRKTLGEGRVDSDFSEEFPYSPLRKPSSIVAGT